MEPQLPAPAEELLGEETLAVELITADVMDGKLPQLFSETRGEKGKPWIAAEPEAAMMARGEAALEKSKRQEQLSSQEFNDMCHYLDPVGNARKQRFR
jgi:hypothetical protein